MSGGSPEAEFHSILFSRLRAYVGDAETPFESVTIEEHTDRGGAAIVVESDRTASVRIVVERDGIYPLASDVVERARDHANAAGVDCVATCNSNDLFLLHEKSEPGSSGVPFYYLNLRDASLSDPTLDGLIPTMLGAVRYLAEQGRLPQQRERDRVVGLLRSFHGAIWPTFRALAIESYDTEPEFTARFDEWVQENGYDDLEAGDQFSLAAKQYAYLLTNKVLFYEVVREQTPDRVETASGNALDSLVDGVSEARIDRHIDQQFERIQDEIDYEPVFDEGTSLFAAFPHSAQTRNAVVALLESIETKQLAAVDEDLLGELYEELIPTSERKALGQFYTHPDIAEAICRWAVQPTGDDVPRVLDPASGSGTFTVEAYHRIQELSPDSTHQEIVDNIVAVDINRFPLHLTALNLSTRNVREPTSELHTLNDSFFNLSPQDARIPQEDDPGAESGSFDAVVGNPPYIRQENLYPDKEHFRAHLEAFDAGYDSGRTQLSKQSDAYVYFVTHAIRFLREGGRLGVVVPTKWLTTRYGESFQEFLYDQTRVHAIVGFSDRAFSALVDTVVLFVERCGDEQRRRTTTTDFVRVKERLSPDELAAVVGDERTVPESKPFEIETTEEYRVVSVPQRRLDDQGGQKLGYYLYGPSPFISLVNSEKMQRLDEFADVAFGNKTGNNGFFLLDDEAVAAWDIDDRFLQPAIRSVRNIDSLRLERTGEYLLDFEKYVDEVKSKQTGRRSTSDLAEAVKRRLREDGYHSTLRYIERGEADGVPDGRTVSQHTPWFNLGELLVPDLLHPVFYDERVFTVDNAGGFAPTNAIQCVDVDDHDDVLPYVLNSTVYKMLLELWGRQEGGGALQLLTYEVSSVPVPNPERMSESLRARISRAGSALVRGVENAQRDLDEALLEFLELDLSAGELQAAHRAMVERRTAGAATESVLIRDVDDFDDVDLDPLRPDPDPDGGRSTERGGF